ncbi:MAG: L,D-transpeptidase [Acidobacteria bacterium]|nr:L,D-transpeptidase [Acidobacteriota bacterium]
MNTVSNRKIVALMAVTLLALLVSACRWMETSIIQEPTLDVAPLAPDSGPWKIATANTITFTVTAPNAERVKILYRPVIAAGRHIELKTLTTPADRASGKFSTRLKAGADFAGDIWAEVFYPGGIKKETEPIALTTESVVAQESERSDKFTGGKIEKAPLRESQPDINITVNAPAFRLTLWQDGKEVKTYQIGIGRKDFPLPIGERMATQIILNPDWIPPDSSWVEEKANVEPGELITAEDPRNPLGKVKIPLGHGYLIHEAARPSDIGHLVSHGCVRMLTDDIFDLVQKIVAARALGVSPNQIEQAKSSTERLVINLDSPLPVDMNYDTLVVEGGVLHIYPDVYDEGTNTIQNVRAELQSSGVDASQLNDQTLRQMLQRASVTHEYAVRVDDIKAGRALIAGQTQPLTDYSVTNKRVQGQSRPGAGHRQQSPELE